MARGIAFSSNIWYYGTTLCSRRTFIIVSHGCAMSMMERELESREKQVMPGPGCDGDAGWHDSLYAKRQDSKEYWLPLVVIQSSNILLTSAERNFNYERNHLS